MASSNFALRPTDPIEIPGTRSGYGPSICSTGYPLFMLGIADCGVGDQSAAWGPDTAGARCLAITIVSGTSMQPRRVGIARHSPGLLLDVHERRCSASMHSPTRLISYGDYVAPAHSVFSARRRRCRVPVVLVRALCIACDPVWVGGTWPGWIYFGESAVGAVLWPLVSWLLLAPQRRPTDPDETRPL